MIDDLCFDLLFCLFKAVEHVVYIVFSVAPKGKKEWRWQMQQMDKLFGIITDEAEAAKTEGFQDTAEMLMEKMQELTQNSPPQLKRS